MLRKQTLVIFTSDDLRKLRERIKRGRTKTIERIITFKGVGALLESPYAINHGRITYNVLGATYAPLNGKANTNERMGCAKGIHLCPLDKTKKWGRIALVFSLDVKDIAAIPIELFNRSCSKFRVHRATLIGAYQERSLENTLPDLGTFIDALRERK